MTDEAYKAKQWLDEIYEYRKLVCISEEGLQVCESIINNATASYSSSGSGRIDPIIARGRREDNLLSYSEQKVRLEKQQMQCFRKELIALELLDRMNNYRHSALLINKFINGLSITKISELKSFGVSRSNVYEQYKLALEEFAVVLKRYEEDAIKSADIQLSEILSKGKKAI